MGGTMKHLMLIFGLMSLLAVTVSAAENPIDKGSIILAGNAFFMSQSGDLWENGDGDALTTFAIVPSVGYFITPGLLIGIDVTFNRLSQGDASRTDLAAGPMIGYYFNTNSTRTEVKGAVYPFVSAFFNYGQSKFDNDSWDSTTDILQFGGHAGIVYMVSDAVGLNLGVNVWSDSYDYEGATESITGTTVQIGAGFTSFIY